MQDWQLYKSSLIWV